MSLLDKMPLLMWATPVAALAVLAAGLLVLHGAGGSRATAEEGGAASLPAPAQDLSAPAPGAGPQVAVLAGGCFWGVQGVFEHVKGVQQVLSGYAGGEAKTADYDQVSSGTTGHAESVQITYDPRQVSYGTLLRIFFSVAHDPTELNFQGPDYGTQYRSNIFTTDAEQQRVAQAYIAQLNAARVLRAPIVTRVDALRGFYPAEGYHQDYMTHNPRQPYIAFNDLPKVARLKRQFPQEYREQPVLVVAASRQ